MNDGSKYIGLDVHKETIAVAIAKASGGEVRCFGEIRNTPDAIRKLCEKIKPATGGLFFCYESGCYTQECDAVVQEDQWIGGITTVRPVTFHWLHPVRWPFNKVGLSQLLAFT